MRTARYRWYDIAVRLGAWRAGAHVKLDFSGGPKVHLDTGSLKGAALSKQEGAGRIFTFELVAREGRAAHAVDAPGRLHLPDGAAPRDALGGGPPPLVRPAAARRRAAAVAAAAAVPPVCDLAAGALAAAVCAVPTHTDDFCVLGGQLRINKVWAGGYSFEAHLTMAVWRPGADVVLDFAKGRADGADYSNIGLTHASNAQVLPRPHKGAVGVRLGAEPDEAYGAIVVGGAKVHDAPVVTCARASPASRRRRRAPSPASSRRARRWA